MSPPILAWHFCRSDGLMRDGRPYAPVGVWQSVPDPSQLEMCEYGYHASRRAIDAVGWARAGVDTCAELVELGGWRQSHIDHIDKDCCQRRRALGRLSEQETDLVLRLHALWCASWALHRYFPAGEERTHLYHLLRVYAVSLRSGDDAARSAARSAMNADLERRLLRAMGRSA